MCGLRKPDRVAAWAAPRFRWALEACNEDERQADLAGVVRNGADKEADGAVEAQDSS
jgi:hypothetical protein